MLINTSGDFPGGQDFFQKKKRLLPMQGSSSEGSIPGQGAKILHASWPKTQR